jgi:hypothetical protein
MSDADADADADADLDRDTALVTEDLQLLKKAVESQD